MLSQRALARLPYTSSNFLCINPLKQQKFESSIKTSLKAVSIPYVDLRLMIITLTFVNIKVNYEF